MTAANYDEALQSAVTQVERVLDTKLAEYQTAETEKRDALQTEIDGLREMVSTFATRRTEGLKRNSIPGVEYDETGQREGEAFSLWRAMQIAEAQRNPHGPCGKFLKAASHGYEMEVQKTYNQATDSAGGVFVPTEVMQDSIVPQLDSVAAVRRAGATTIDGLVNDVLWPANEGGFAAYYPDTETAEDSITESANTFGQRTATPHTMAALQKMSHKQMVQYSLEPFVRSEFIRKFALREDITAVEGTGSGQVPQGIVGATGVTNGGSIIGGTSTTAATMIDNLTEFMYQPALNSAADPNGRYAWLLTPDVARAYQGATDTNGRRLLEPWGNAPGGMLTSLMGAPVFMSQAWNTSTPGVDNDGATFALYGDFSKLLLCSWNSLTIRATETGDDAAKLRTSIIGYRDHDVVLVHPEAFVYATAVDVTL